MNYVLIKSQVLFCLSYLDEYRGFIPYLTSSELSVRPARYYSIEIRGVINSITLRLIGRNLFHVRDIKLSYRMRGSVARIQINSVATNIVLRISVRFINIGIIPVKKIDVNKLIIKMFAYSAIKIRANLLLLYSTLKPDTSSDSPSAKSNGVRLVSARLVINQDMARGIIIRLIHECIFIDMIDISM
jgi:hypothetical protein